MRCKVGDKDGGRSVFLSRWSLCGDFGQCVSMCVCVCACVRVCVRVCVDEE